MTNEIKEIREYISCPQFGDDHYGKWGALRLDQRIKIKQLLDYITNLQEEIKRQEKSQVILDNQNAELQERINKAIEYINNHTIEWIDKHFEEHNVMVAFNEYSNPQALKDILQGE